MNPEQFFEKEKHALTLEAYHQQYFYKTELVQLCRQHKLPTYGTKAELNSYLEQFLSGTPANQIHSKRPNHNKSRHQLTTDEISLTTKLLDPGFSFNQAARQFFANYFHVQKFSFKKSMAVIKRKAEAEHDTQITVDDLIQQMQVPLEDKNHEESTYQWNHFVRDFCHSTSSNSFNNQIKVAAILWQHVKNSKQPKVYHDDLVNKYYDEIKIYQK
ncbi:SAP domain-containing protein [Apilactobacillus sp. TMW 2.2459]|uniref:SAP domain-containing protein n=1 Tax=Apilactobacillus xinyiensis TaxID=2841032 RepID=UPI00200C8204|nr:SAP domain-containing protein [Apilactobacillus xinyiensis]MCL0312285.1 SAP domain-containing protein [Apilactobacillus xinyiensis]